MNKLYITLVLGMFATFNVSSVSPKAVANAGLQGISNASSAIAQAARATFARIQSLNAKSAVDTGKNCVIYINSHKAQCAEIVILAAIFAYICYRARYASGHSVSSASLAEDHASQAWFEHAHQMEPAVGVTQVTDSAQQDVEADAFNDFCLNALTFE